MTVVDYLNAKDQALLSPQDMNPSAFGTSSLEFGSIPEGLYATSCDFKPLDKKTNREFKASSTMFINTFRFGIGDDFSQFNSDRLYTPISDRFCGFTDYDKYQKDRYINYPEITSPYTDVDGYIPWQSMNLWGEGKPERAVAGAPCNTFTDPDCYLPSFCTSNIDSVVQTLNGQYEYSCNKYLWNEGEHQQNPEFDPNNPDENCWGLNWNSSVVRNIRWTCSENSKEYASKGACMQDCYPVRECSLPTGDNPNQFPFLYPNGAYRTQTETLTLSKPDGTEYGEETATKLNTSFYASNISQQYDFELANGYCPENGCVCYDDQDGDFKFDQGTEEASPELCASPSPQIHILNIIPGASAVCQSDGECFSGVCNKNLIPRNKCVLQDGTPVDCGCYVDAQGFVKCKPNDGVQVNLRQVDPSSDWEARKCFDGMRDENGGGDSVDTFNFGPDGLILARKDYGDPSEPYSHYFTKDPFAGNPNSLLAFGFDQDAPLCQVDVDSDPEFTYIDPIPDEDWLFDKVGIFYEDEWASGEADGRVDIPEELPDDNCWDRNGHGTAACNVFEEQQYGYTFIPEELEKTNWCQVLSLGDDYDHYGDGGIFATCGFYGDDSGAYGTPRTTNTPIEITMSSSSDDPTLSRAYTVLYGLFGLPGDTKPDGSPRPTVESAIPLISSCNMVAGRDYHFFWGLYNPWTFIAGPASSVALVDTNPQVIQETLVIFTSHKDESGETLFGECKSDPNTHQLQIYSWGACEPCSLATSAVQQISATQDNSPICLTGSDSYGSCTISQNICTNCQFPSPFKNYNDTNAKGQTILVSDGEGGLTKSMEQQGPSFLPDPVYLHSELQKYQKGSTIPILVIPNSLAYSEDTTYTASQACAATDYCSTRTNQQCIAMPDSQYCIWEWDDDLGSTTCHPRDNCGAYPSCGQSPYCEATGEDKTDPSLPANLAKYLKDQGTTILAVHTFSWPEAILPNPGGYILRDPDAVQAIKNKVIYYKQKFPSALTAVIIPTIDARQPRLDSQIIPMQDAVGISYALALNSNAEGNTVPTDPDGGGPMPTINYKQIIQGPASGTLDSNFLNHLDLIILKPYIPEMGYYSGGGQAFCTMQPEEQATLLATNLTNTSRQFLQDFNTPSLLYLGDRATWAEQCDSSPGTWTETNRSRLTQELIRFSTNLTYAGIIGLHDSHGLPSGYSPLDNPEDQPFCILQNASRLTVDLATETGFYRLAASENTCGCEKRTKAEQTAAVSDICADGWQCDIKEGEEGWDYGYKCPPLCARKSVCDGTNAAMQSQNEPAHLCTENGYDGDASSDSVTCTYTDGTVKNPPPIQTMAIDDPDTPNDEPDYYIDFLSSLPRDFGCCIPKTDDFNLDGQIQPDEISYYTYAKLDMQGRSVNPVIYGTRGGEFPECKPGLEITESCVFANLFSNQQLSCEAVPGIIGQEEIIVGDQT